MTLEEMAKDFATEMHEGQFRKGNGQPYITHPKAVVELMQKYGFNDETSKAIGWLHDTLEDCQDKGVTYEVLEKTFGPTVGMGVYLLSRTEDCQERDAYKHRLIAEDTPLNIKAAKVADMIHNTSTLDEITKFKTIKRKVVEAIEFYIPFAETVNTEMAEELKGNIRDYFIKNPQLRIDDYFRKTEKEEELRPFDENNEKSLRAVLGM